MLKLYDYFRSSAAFRVRIALNYKGLTYEKIKINLLEAEQSNPEYTEINPSGLVPVLLNESSQTIRQSLSIIEYLDEEYPEPALLPKSAFERAYVRALALDVACDIHPLNNLRILSYLKKSLGHSQDEVNTWYQHWIELGLTALEQNVVKGKFYTGKYCYRDQFTMADICLLPQLVNARRFHCPLDKFPTLLAIEAQCLVHEVVASAYPDKQ